MDDLLSSIDEFLARHDMSERQFGEFVLNDKNLVRQLRDGRDLRMSTLQRIKDFIIRDMPSPSQETPAYVPSGTSPLSS